MECLNQYVDRYGSIEAEGLVADYAYLWHVFGKVVGHHGDILIGTHKNGNVLGLLSFAQEHGNSICQLVENLSLIVFGR